MSAENAENAGNAVPLWHEMRIEFVSLDLAFSCLRYFKDKYPEIQHIRMRADDGKAIVTLAKKCSVDEWVKILQSFK